jgi:hypothetical protein
LIGFDGPGSKTTDPKPPPTLLASGHAARPISISSALLARQTGTALPSNTVPGGAAMVTLVSAGDFPSGSSGSSGSL